MMCDSNEKKWRLGKVRGGLFIVNAHESFQSLGDKDSLQSSNDITEDLTAVKPHKRANNRRRNNSGSIKELAVTQLSSTLKNGNCVAHSASRKSSFKTSCSFELCMDSTNYFDGLEVLSDDVDDSFPDEVELQTNAETKSKPSLRKNKPSLFVSVAECEGFSHTASPSNIQLGSFFLTETGISCLSENGSTDSCDGCASSRGQILPKKPFLHGGSSDFVEVQFLGKGFGGLVVEAIHIPTLTIVALKRIPIHETDKLENISSELDILIRNLAELELVDTSLREEIIDDKFSPFGRQSAFSNGFSDDPSDKSHNIPSPHSVAMPAPLPRRRTRTALKCPCAHLVAMYDGACLPYLPCTWSGYVYSLYAVY
jgi:hypothetical protein